MLTATIVLLGGGGVAAATGVFDEQSTDVAAAVPAGAVTTAAPASDPTPEPEAPTSSPVAEYYATGSAAGDECMTAVLTIERYQYDMLYYGSPQYDYPPPSEVLGGPLGGATPDQIQALAGQVLAVDEEAHSTSAGEGPRTDAAIAGCQRLTRPAGASTPAPAPDTHSEPLRGDDFKSPSENLLCSISAESVYCIAAEQDWPAVDEPCYGYDVDGAIVAGTAPAEQACLGYELFEEPNAEQQTLEYWDEIRVGDFRCTSTPTGMTCRNDATARGFTMSRKELVLFNW